MKRNLLLSLCAMILAIGFTVMAQPKQEVRAVWLTTNGGSDWPSTTNESSQKNTLINYLNRLQAANFNTILLQVQVKGDVIWDSSYQPSMKTFTGDGSKNLSWDVCSFVIDECHKRGMECHAWIVPYRIGTSSEANRYAANPKKHPYLAHPEWCVLNGGAYYLDPGLPEVRAYLIDLYRELVANYDFDGTNFDYTRYPSSTFADDASYNKYGDGMNRADWRRQNINTFVHEFYDMAKSLKPSFKVGSAPIGTYQNAPGYGNMTAYGSVFQDPVEWMNAGKQDICFPQLYWNETYGFTPHLKMWAEKANGRHIVAGLAPYKMLDKNNWAVSVVTDQIEKSREYEGVYGVCFFRTMMILGSETKYKELYTQLKDNYFKYPANIPAMDYNGITKPNAPANVTTTVVDGKLTISWDTPALDASDTPIKYYCVYSASRVAEIADMSKCISHYITGNSLTIDAPASDMSYAVTTFDANYYESAPAFVKHSGVTAPMVANSLIFGKDKITAEFDSEIAEAQIVNAQGATVIVIAPESSHIEIAIDQLPQGFYLLTVRDAKGNAFSEKFIK